MPMIGNHLLTSVLKYIRIPIWFNFMFKRYSNYT